MEKKLNFEEIQNSNPHRLTIKQHIIPRASIKRFYNDDKRIELKNLSSKKQQKLLTNENDEIFIVKSLWSQKTEASIMKSIEDKFQKLVDKIINEKLSVFSVQENQIICNMYSLWEFRTHYIEEFTSSFINTPLYETTPPNITKDEEEILESKGACFISKDNTFSTRFILEFEVNRFIDMKFSYRKNIKWGLLKSEEAEFIMPSNPINNNNAKDKETIIFPITPYLCLIPIAVFEIIQQSEVKELNEILVKNSKSFYFAKDFTCC
ncbi:MAG: DUF4238 domain-containing protein [Sulfurimonas sp.]|jgi:hypothetical protein